MNWESHSNGIEKVICHFWRVFASYSVIWYADRREIWCSRGKTYELAGSIQRVKRTMRFPKTKVYYRATRENRKLSPAARNAGSYDFYWLKTFQWTFLCQSKSYVRISKHSLFNSQILPDYTRAHHFLAKKWQLSSHTPPPYLHYNVNFIQPTSRGVEGRKKKLSTGELYFWKLSNDFVTA